MRLPRPSPRTQRLFIRNIEAGDSLEVFLVSAVAAILAIRGFLELTGYPELGDDDLHIAHMLWGGLLMLVSIVIHMTFLGKGSERLATIAGGIGFGTFIDEVGKFVTQDNDYFFEPSVAIMYVIFILLFLSVRALQTSWRYSSAEYLMNAIRYLEEVAMHDLDPEEKRRIQSYLDGSDPDNPLVADLQRVLQDAETVPAPLPNHYLRLTRWLHARYYALASYPWFHLMVIVLFLIQMTGSFTYVVTVALAPDHGDLSWVDSAQLTSSLVSAMFVLWGVLALHRSRLTSFRMLKRSVLVSIFLTRVFVFYEEQFGALVGLAIDLLLLMALRFMIERESLEQPREA